jgi:hypothetical protein
MDRTNGLEQTASTSLSERLHRPEKGMVGERPKPSAKRSALTRSRRR